MGRGLFFFGLAAVIWSGSVLARAQQPLEGGAPSEGEQVAVVEPAPVDADAPSMAVHIDRPPPSLRTYALTADLVSPFFGRWGATFEAAVVPSQSFFGTLGYLSRGSSPGVTIEVGWHAWFLDKGLDGPFAGLAGRLDIEAEGGTARTLAVGSAEVGWQIDWVGIVAVLAGGISAESVVGEQGDPVLAPRVRVGIGFTW